MSSPTVTVSDRYTDDQVEHFRESGFWRDQILLDLLEVQVHERADVVYVLDGTSTLTYRETYEQAVRLAVGLRRLGVDRGDRVAVQLPNWTEFVVVMAAIGAAGGIIVPIMPIYRDDEVGFVLAHSGATTSVTAGEFRGFDYAAMHEALRAENPAVTNLVTVRVPDGQGPTGSVALESLFVDGAIEDLLAELGPRPGGDDPFTIVYTSGTTSRPKGCFHTFNTMCASARAIGVSIDYTGDDVQFGPSPISHSTGLVTSIMLPALHGATSVLMPAWDPAEGVRMVQEHRCTVTTTATAFLQMFMGAFDPTQHDASSLRIWVCAGSPIPGEIVRRAREKFAGCQVLSLYGRSENLLTTMCTVRDPEDRSATSDGSALMGAEVQIVDPFGEQVPAGTEGDVAYRGPSHMLGYYRDPEQTALLFTDAGFSRSGDLGVMDADGFVRITGRLKDIVIRGGMNISARELEELLGQHPAVAQVAVVGMPDERLGERVCAYVVPAGADAPGLADVVQFLRERKIATAKLPERLEIITQLPLTATGKVQKHVLRADIAAKLETTAV